MSEPISIAVKMFNDRVKQMNQINSKQMTLSADEARNLHSDIYTLLATIAELKGGESSVQVAMDGGTFK